MKLTMYSGCTRGDAIDVDGVDIMDFSENKQREIAIEVFTALLELDNTKNMIRELILSYYTDFEDLGTCDQCGDNTINYTLEV